MIEIKKLELDIVEKGYYEVYVGGEYKDRFTKPSKADAYALSEKLKNPDSVVKIIQPEKEAEAIIEIEEDVTDPIDPIEPENPLDFEIYGYGKGTVGGLGGQVYYVTNTNDSGEGSLRSICEMSGKRIVNFNGLGGQIKVSSTIQIDDPNITILGETAGGDGICISAEEDARQFATMSINTGEVIIRHLRFRRSETDYSDTNDDNLRIDTGSYNVVIDHCSFSQAADEALSLHDYSANGSVNVRNISIQNCIIGRAYGGTSKGMINSGSINKITWFNNFFASNGQRNVLLKTDEGYGTTEDTYFEFVNNCIYDAKWVTVYNDKDPNSGMRHLNYFNNYYFEDKGTSRRMVSIDSPYPVKLFVQNNITPNRPTISSPVNWDEEWLVTQGTDDNGGTPAHGEDDSYEYADKSYQSIIPFDTPLASEIDNLPIGVAVWEAMKDHVGASLPKRDLYDEARISDAENKEKTFEATGEEIQEYKSY